MRKTNLARLLAHRVDGIFLSDFEQGEIGPDLFRHACLMGLEGMVSMHRDRPFAALGQGQEPQACVQPGSGSVRLSRRRAGRRRSRLSVIGSPPLPLAAACAPGSFWRYGRPWRASPLGDGLHHMAAESPCREPGKTR